MKLSGGVLCTALAALPFSFAKTHIDPELYGQIQRYTNFSVASLSQPCANPPYGSSIVKYFNILSTSTQATVYRDDYEKEFIVGFPGTSSARDEKTDSEAHLSHYSSIGVNHKNCPHCHTHTGFGKAWNSIARDMVDFMHDLEKAEPDYRIVITGHSLGAALASLMTATMRGLHNKGHFRNLGPSYTFGQPRVGDKAYADYMDRVTGVRGQCAGSYHRVTHADDPVPQEPTQGDGYRHHGTEYWELNTPDGSQDVSHTWRCYGQEPPNCSDSTTRRNFVESARGPDPHLIYSGMTMENPASCGA